MLHAIDIGSLKPFEICSIRPPTENQSLTFRLTRNCYWNRCAFCPVYKLGARFSRRSLDEVLDDIASARALDDFLSQRGMALPASMEADPARLACLAEEIDVARRETGRAAEDVRPEFSVPEDLDPRLAWFLSWFNSRPGIADCMGHILSWRAGGGTTCFLGDADALILKPDFLARVIGAARTSFPTLSRFTVYGRTATAARLRSSRELRAFARAGLDRVHFGLESGSDRVLEMADKGVTAAEHVSGCIKTREAGLSCSVYVMPGLGGASLSEEHARETAAALTAIAPDFVRLRTLEVFPGTRLADVVRTGEFTEATEEQVVREIRILIEETRTKTDILSDSASNLLGLFGRLPEDRTRMLRMIDDYLGLSMRERLEFSLHARLESFIGQYGGVTQDVLDSLRPFVNRDRLDCSQAGEHEIEEAIRLIRSKLMP